MGGFEAGGVEGAACAVGVDGVGYAVGFLIRVDGPLDALVAAGEVRSGWSWRFSGGGGAAAVGGGAGAVAGGAGAGAVEGVGAAEAGGGDGGLAMVVRVVARDGSLVVVDAVAGEIGCAGVHAVLESALGILLEVGCAVSFTAVDAESFTPGGRIALAVA